MGKIWEELEEVKILDKMHCMKKIVKVVIAPTKKLGVRKHSATHIVYFYLEILAIMLVYLF